jgi:hypothetical protein
MSILAVPKTTSMLVPAQRLILENMPGIVAIPWPIVDAVVSSYIALAGAVAIAFVGATRRLDRTADASLGAYR